MNEPSCREADESPVKTAILKTLGVRRVSGWCSVSDAAVYQWLSRAKIPMIYVPKIISGARREGLAVDVAIFWPEFAEAMQ